MNTFPLAVIGLFIAPLVVTTVRQERQKPKEAADVPTLLQQAGKAWEAKQFGACSRALRKSLQLIGHERAKVIRAALPNAPEGFEKVVVNEAEEAAATAYMATLAMGIGSMIQQSYRDTKGDGSIDVTIAADSPLAQMFSMWITNPAMLEQGSEVVKYGAHTALLKKDGSGWQLMLLVGQDLCTVTLQGRNDEFLLKMFDQAAVDRLAAAMTN